MLNTPPLHLSTSPPLHLSTSPPLHLSTSPPLHHFNAMPFDPSLPLPNSPLESPVIRDPLQALFVLNNNIVSVIAAQVNGVNTLPPWHPGSGECERERRQTALQS